MGEAGGRLGKEPVQTFLRKALVCDGDLLLPGSTCPPQRPEHLLQPLTTAPVTHPREALSVHTHSLR